MGDMDGIITVCYDCCKKHNQPYRVCADTDSCYNGVCTSCGGYLTRTGITRKEWRTIIGINNVWPFVQSMIDLKQSDPIAFQQKISEFEIQIEEKQRLSAMPKCPKCGSTSITTGSRGVNGFWGFIGASKTVNRCGNCGYTWKP